MKTEGTSQKGESCQSTMSSVDGSHNLQWYKLNIDGISLYLFYSFFSLFQLFFIPFYSLFSSFVMFSLFIILINERYAQFVDSAVLDGQNRKVGFELAPASNNNVLLTVPAFWEVAGTLPFIILSFFLSFYYNCY